MGHLLWRACVGLAAMVAPFPAFAQPLTPAGARPDATQVQTAADAREESLRKLIEAWVDRCGVPGATLAAIGPDGEVVKVAAGFSRLATQTAMLPDDRMLAGSIGKTYFATATLMLVEEGVLKLDEPIRTYVEGEKWFAGLPNAEHLTLRMLLGHTSGIREHVDTPEFIAVLKADPMKHWDFGALLEEFVCGREPLFEAGKGWSYADTNYIVAGLVVERATGKAMYEHVRERVLTQLALHDTIPSDRPVLPGLITGYEGPAHTFTDAEEFAVDGRCVLNPQMEWCGGGFVSTGPDLARWARALWGDKRVLSEAIMAEMLTGTPQQRTGPNDAYGLGVIIWQSPLGRALGHTGMFPGYVSQVFHFEDAGVTVAMQCNSMDFARLKGMRAILADAARLMGPGQ